MRNIYGVAQGDVFWAASDVGWVVGHSYIVYAPLVHGCTTLLYEGKPVGTPDAGALWRIADHYRINVLFVAPTAIRAVRGADPDGEFPAQFDLTSLRAIFLAGERADPATIQWAEQHLAKPVIDHWWQTETGWPAAANFLGLELLSIVHGSAGFPVPGFAIEVVDDAGSPVAANQSGNIVIRLPLPPGCLHTLWNAHEEFRRTYLTTFPGCYATGDAGFADDEGRIFFMSRTDDIINVAGHRLSTGLIEQAICEHRDVAECAVVGMGHAIKGAVPFAFAVLKQGAALPPSEAERQLIALVRQTVGAIATPHSVLVVERLPKTRSGKTLRRSLRDLVEGQTVEIPPTIEDASVLDAIAVTLNETMRR